MKHLSTYFPKQEYLCFLLSSQWRRRSWLLEWHQSRRSGEPLLILLLLLAMPVCLLHLSSGIHQQATSSSLLPSAKHPLPCKELGKQLCCHRNTLKSWNEKLHVWLKFRQDMMLQTELKQCTHFALLFLSWFKTTFKGKMLFNFILYLNTNSF